MPLAAFFCKVGAALLALLLIADFYLPRPAVVQSTPAPSHVIRIHATPKWPEPVIFDTGAPTVAAGPAASNSKIDAVSVADAASADNVVPPAAREAFAMLPQADSRQMETAAQDKRKSSQKIAAKSTRKYARPRYVFASPQFAWFGFRYR